VTLFARVRGSRFLRFAAVGGAGFFVNEGVLFVAIRWLHLGAYAGGIFAFLLTVTFTWWGNRMLTFRDETAHRGTAIIGEWFKFVAANAIGFVVYYAVYASLVTFAPTPLNSPYVAPAFGTLAGLIFNFMLSKRFVFHAAD
jgi:putative flippase GtrA